MKPSSVTISRPKHGTAVGCEKGKLFFLLPVGKLNFPL